VASGVDVQAPTLRSVINVIVVRHVFFDLAVARSRLLSTTERPTYVHDTTRHATKRFWVQTDRRHK
jgi:hypothetical protein